jgi:hypothetical protein
MKKVISRISVGTVFGLHQALKQMTYVNSETIYVTDENGDELVLELVENTLSDKSITYDIIIKGRKA